MTTSTETSGARWHDLDAVRAFALLLGVVLHGVMSFMTPRIWIIADTVTGTGPNIAFYIIHIFRMTTFFVLAGFFARMMMEKRGVGGFIGNRLKRVAVPLVIFWPIVLATIIAVAIIANMPAPGAVAAPAPPPPAFNVATFPLTHLWFLYVLLLLYAGAILIKLVTDVLHVGGVLGRVLDKVVGALTKTDLISALLIVPVAATMYVAKGWMLWFGIPTPDTGLIPNAMATAGFVTAFTFGWWLHRSPDLIDHLACRFWMYGLSAGIGTWWCLSIAGHSPAFTPVNGQDHPLYCLLYPLTAWSWALALIGAGRAFLKRENPMVRLLSDASYWVYIMHIPVLMGLQFAVRDLAWPLEAKAAAVLMGTLTICVLSYVVFVRYTFIGTILNGRRRKAKVMAQSKEATA